MNLRTVSAPGPVAGIFLLLSLALVVGLGLRAYGGITWGLPERFHHDEPAIIDQAARIAATRNPDIQWFIYPSLYIYLQATLEPIGRPLQPLVDQAYDGDRETLVKARQLLVGRIVTVLIGTASIAGVFLLASRSYGRSAGLLGAAILAVHVLHVKNSQWVTTDVPSAAAVLGVGIAAIVGLQTRSFSWLLAGGVVAGLAAGIKYPVGLSVLMPLMAAAMLWRGGGLARNCGAILLVAGCTFLATTPYALIHLEEFLSDMQYNAEHHRVIGHAGAEGPDTWKWYIERFILASPPVGALMAAGIVYALIRHRREDAILAVFLFAYYALIAAQIVRWERWLIPIVPVAAALAGRLAADALQWARRVPFRRVAAPALSVVLVLVLASGALQALEYDRTRTLNDTRHEARQWIADNIPAGARIVKEFYTPTLGSEYEVTKYFGLYQHSFEQLVCEGDYLIASSLNFDRFFVPSDPYPERREVYERVFELPIRHEIRPGADMTGPRIVILRVPTGMCQGGESGGVPTRFGS